MRLQWCQPLLNQFPWHTFMVCPHTSQYPWLEGYGTDTSITANGRSALCRRMLCGQLIYIFSQLIFIEPYQEPGTGLKTGSKAINKIKSLPLQGLQQKSDEPRCIELVQLQQRKLLKATRFCKVKLKRPEKNTRVWPMWLVEAPGILASRLEARFLHSSTFKTMT